MSLDIFAKGNSTASNDLGNVRRVMATFLVVSTHEVCRALKFPHVRLSGRAAFDGVQRQLDEALARRIEHLSELRPTFSYRRRWAVLCSAEGIRLDRKAVYRMLAIKVCLVCQRSLPARRPVRGLRNCAQSGHAPAMHGNAGNPGAVQCRRLALSQGSYRLPQPRSSWLRVRVAGPHQGNQVPARLGRACRLGRGDESLPAAVAPMKA